MFALGALSFIAPIALFGLIALPVIYWLLRVIPPAPRRVRFPAIRLIMRLINPEESSAETPLWLTLLRLALVTLVILGAAHPLLNAVDQFKNDGPLVVVIDDDWAAAKNWNKRQTALANLIDQAERDNRALAIITTAPGEGKTRVMESLLSPEAAREIVRALKPKPWQADRRAAASVINDIKLDGRANIFWLSNGLDNHDADEFAKTLTALGDVMILAGPPSELPVILLPPTSDRDGLTLQAKRSQGSNVAGLKLRIRDDQGAIISRKTLIFEAGKSDGKLKLELPVEIRNRITPV